MIRIQVLLSTYNGSRFLREQIDSILKQTDVEVCILIRDDGSKEETKVILSQYEKHENIAVIYGQNKGVVQSFFHLIKNAGEYDYYAFCDQDDVWMPNKLSRAAERLLNFDNNEPLLYTSCAQIVDEHLNNLGYSILPQRGISFYNAMIENISSGNTQVFNAALKALLCKIDNTDRIVMHDHFAYITASAFGKVIFDDAATLLYRQHTGNVVGMSKGILKLTKERIYLVFSGNIKRISIQLEYFINVFGCDLKVEYLTEANHFLNARRLTDRLNYVFHKKAYYQKPFASFAFWILFLAGFLRTE